MKAQSDALQRALDYLGAVEVAPGRYAFQDEQCEHGSGEDGCLVAAKDCEGTTRSWFTIAEYDLPAYANGRRGVRYAKMPSWWSPEQRFAWRVFSPSGDSWGTVAELMHEAPTGTRGQRITASLDTGEEVPC